MDILQDIVFPQSPTHILLLKYLFFLTLLLLLPYLSVLIGTTLFSVMHFHQGKKFENRNSLIFAKELIDLFTVNKSMAIALGIVPFLSLIFILAQLLYGTKTNFTPDLIFALLLLVSSLFYIYIYKYSFSLKNAFNLVNVKDISNQNSAEEFKALRKSNSKLLSKSGIIGLILLLISVYILIGVIKIVSLQISEIDFLTILISTDTILYFLFYLAFSISITCAAIIFKYFKSDAKKYKSDYLNFIKIFTLKTGLIFTFIQPFLFVISFITSPENSLSFSIFITGTLTLLLMLVISILFYLMHKDSKTHLGGSAVLVFLILTATLIYKDHLAFETKNVKNLFEQEKAYKIFSVKVKEEAGITEIVEIKGEDIYNAKCIACHRFDTKLVGPAYNDVLPKYDGKRVELIDFILNPRKVNPEFTAMPNQGLKPKEAEAIADYIVKMYKENKK
ncbi:MAG: cytochrome c [Ignavibacteriae bacterium]|nr:cytochrome c [Ignavibacteriota bacterium]